MTPREFTNNLVLPAEEYFKRGVDQLNPEVAAAMQNCTDIGSGYAKISLKINFLLLSFYSHFPVLFGPHNSKFLSCYMGTCCLQIKWVFHCLSFSVHICSSASLYTIYNATVTNVPSYSHFFLKHKQFSICFIMNMFLPM